MKRASIAGLRVLPLVGVALALTACGAAARDPGGPSALPAASGGPGQPSLALLGSWRALSLAPAGQGRVTIDEPVRFSVEFAADGKLALVADCNRCSGGYSAGPGSLQATPMACTRAWCASAPVDTQFTALVGAATSWRVDDDRLELASSAGVARLQR